jgi:phosphoribosylformylglycinamidine synthase I
VIEVNGAEIKVGILRVAGTNCDLETRVAFEELGAKAQVVHMNRIVKGDPSLKAYDILILPGGFSYGDYIRAGAIWAKEIVARLGGELIEFVKAGKPVLGICNGFQVLVEAGLLPGFDGPSQFPEAALATNASAEYECRWIWVRHVNRGQCLLTASLPQHAVLRMPVAHGEGRFTFDKEREEVQLTRLRENDQLVFTYAAPDGGSAGGTYPHNPNGSIADIAGICNPQGNVLGLMPHPERAFYGWQLPDWQVYGLQRYGDGKLLIESILKFYREKFG